MRFEQKLDIALNESLNDIQIISMGEHDEEVDDLQNQAWELAKTSSIRILRDKELTNVAVRGGQVLGALFTGITNNEYSFDVIVDPKHHRQGIGSALIKTAIEDYRQLKFDITDLKLRLDVVNPTMVPILQKLGLKIIDQQGGHILMS